MVGWNRRCLIHQGSAWTWILLHVLWQVPHEQTLAWQLNQDQSYQVDWNESCWLNAIKSAIKQLMWKWFCHTVVEDHGESINWCPKWGSPGMIAIAHIKSTDTIGSMTADPQQHLKACSFDILPKEIKFSASSWCCLVTKSQEKDWVLLSFVFVFKLVQKKLHLIEVVLLEASPLATLAIGSQQFRQLVLSSSPVQNCATQTLITNFKKTLYHHVIATHYTWEIIPNECTEKGNVSVGQVSGQFRGTRFLTAGLLARFASAALLRFLLL